MGGKGDKEADIGMLLSGREPPTQGARDAKSRYAPAPPVEEMRASSTS